MATALHYMYGRSGPAYLRGRCVTLRAAGADDRGMRIPGIVSLMFLGACAEEAQIPESVYSTRTVVAVDSSGVGTATCSSSARIVGGGCNCLGVSDVLFAAGPAGNSYVCGCYDYGEAAGSVEVAAICLGSSKAGTLTQGLETPGAEALAVAEKYRSMRLGGR